tara:strand:- start:9100 stop:9966 length:867 start_codon:yes stop_codon:yes gene_type:complete
MVSVAQKTLFLLFLTFLTLFFTQINTAQAKTTDIFKSENLTYKVSLNGLYIGEAVISYQPNKEKNSYKLLAKAKSKGVAKSIYNINDSINVYGHIIKDELVPSNHTVILKENGYKASKTANFNYDMDLLKITNNKSNDNWTFVLMNRASDIFSSLFTLRFNTDLTKNDNSLTFNRTMQFADKTIKNKIKISSPFNFKIDKETRIKARNVTVSSTRVKLNHLSEESLAVINAGKRSALNFLDESINTKKTYKEEQNINVVVSSDSRKIPLVIEYSTKFGTFKAVLKKYN